VPVLGGIALDEADMMDVVHAQQVGTAGKRRFQVQERLVQTLAAQLLVNGGQARRALRVPGAHLVLATDRVGDIGGGHRSLFLNHYRLPPRAPP